MRGQNISELGAAAKTMVVGTAGHIDHGKTALIRALTGVDTDRLPEEKKRGITIDLGFASMSVAGEDGAPVQVSFIDVPGHANFVRNMLAGTGGIDAVLLVISAEEGVKSQTEEHLAICSLLGIRHGMVALTKIDAVDGARLRAVRESVEGFLSTTFLAGEPMVCASAFTGAGLDALRREVGLLATRIAAREAEFLPRVPLDRAFAMKGFGTVVTGTLIAGALNAGAELAIEPGGRNARVRGLQVHGRAAGRAQAATRVALNLNRVDAAEVHRGDTLVEPATIAAVDTIDAEIRLLNDAQALAHRARVHFHAFASESMAAVSLYGYEAVEPGTRRLARLRLTRPSVLLPGDRFVLRRGDPLVTVGGGMVLDSHPMPRLKKARARDWLEQARGADRAEQLALRVARRGVGGISVTGLSTETGLRAEAIATLLKPLIEEERIWRFDSGLLVSRDALREAATTAQEQLEKMLPRDGSAGVKRASLASQTRLRAEVLDWALGDLEKGGRIRVRNELIAPAQSGAAGAAREQERAATVDRAFAAAGLACPAPNELAAKLAMDAAGLRRSVSVLLREKKLVRLGNDDLCVHASALAELKERMRGLRGKSIDVGQFKELAGVSRKYAIPLLEYLDRERVTRRQGDKRIVL